MRDAFVSAVCLVSILAVGCAFESTSTLLTPIAPTGNIGVAGTTTPTAASSSTGGNSTGTPASAFSGAWGASSFAGLPIAECADLKWVISEQSATSVAGTLTATCAGGARVNANLSGTTTGNSTVNLAAIGTIVAAGIPCGFDLSGVGTRQNNDSMKLDYKGSYCLGTLSGTEMLRRFPTP
jgi:hypothetical protein